MSAIRPAGMTRLASLGMLLLALTVAALLVEEPGITSLRPHAATKLVVALLALSVVVYLLAVRLVMSRALPSRALWIVLAVGLLARAILLPAPAYLSSDIYRYVWDGRVQQHGINPYRYLPADPSLSGLRDTSIFPLVNRASYARTIYPPVAQMLFALVVRISGTVQAMKLAMVGLELTGLYCMMRLLVMAGLPRERILIQAWNPLVIWSFACDGHVDGAAIGLIGLALLARSHRRDGLAGGVLAAAALVKFLPLALAPAFARGVPLWRPALAGLVVVVVGYACYASAGRYILGFLPGYSSEEGLSGGNGFWLLAGLAHLGRLPAWSGTAYIVAAGAGLALLGLWITWGGQRLPEERLRSMHRPADDVVLLCRNAAILAAAVTVAISPHYSWYFAWLALPCVVAPIPAVIWLSSAPVLLTLDPFNERFVWPSLVYAPAIVLAVIALRRRRSARCMMAATSEGTC
ncbi:glycosyltransferase 87 family protein [Lichenicola sp.]|uniref:glycosyltransferase 87 family protein n=1 Tax=Lichenicola sp. TaxID=2804529 RepID=UPI003B00E4B4